MENPDLRWIALGLKSERERAGLTQEAVAELSGVGSKTISSFERGDRISGMKVWQLLALLDVYGVSVGEFLETTMVSDGEMR